MGHRVRYNIEENPISEYSNEEIDLDSSKKSLQNKVKQIFDKIEESVKEIDRKKSIIE